MQRHRPQIIQRNDHRSRRQWYLIVLHPQHRQPFQVPKNLLHNHIRHFILADVELSQTFQVLRKHQHSIIPEIVSSYVEFCEGREVKGYHFRSQAGDPIVPDLDFG